MEKSCVDNIKKRIKLIPTLYEVKTTTCEEDEDKVTFKLDAHLLGWEVEKATKGNYKFAASLFPMAQNENSGKSYECEDDKNIRFDFNLPTNDKINRIFFELVDKKDGKDLGIDKNVIAVIDTSSTAGKGSVTYNMKMAEYKKMSLGESVLKKEDGNLAKFYLKEKDITYVFRCWTEKLPIPGKDSGIFVYLDGSSQKTNGVGRGHKEKYGAGYVICADKKLYFGHMEGDSTAANDIGEIQAATLVMEQLLSDRFDLKNQKIRIHYDNQKVGYYPTGINVAKTEHGKNYIEKVNEVAEKYKELEIIFCHVDAHRNIYGNELADRLAQVNKDATGKLNECTKDYEKQRNYICPANGSCSKAFVIFNGNNRIGKKHDRWYIADMDESQETWLVGDKSDKPQDSFGKKIWDIAQEMEAAIKLIRFREVHPRIKASAANRLRELLQECSWDENLSHLTYTFRDKEADNIIGYDTSAVSKFVGLLLLEYPEP